MDLVNFSIDLAIDESRASGSPMFTARELEAIAPAVDSASKKIESARTVKNEFAFLDLATAYHQTAASDRFSGQLVKARQIITAAAETIHEVNGDFVHLGIGGSALGSILLNEALCTYSQGESGSRVFIPDNVDPELIHNLLHEIRPDITFLNVVSKSGDTVETIATFSILYDHLKKAVKDPEKLRERIFVTTNPLKGSLVQLANEFGFTVVPLPDEIHGRFSILSPSGLFGAAVGGVKIDDLLNGARYADEWTRDAAFWKNPAKMLAALHFLGDTQKGIRCLILLPYVQALKTLADWYSQLVAESLGKQGKGVTPVKALGATDQHSQLQLYNDGPKDKLVVFIGVEEYRTHVEIPSVFSHIPGYSYLRDQSLNDLLTAEKRGTAVSLYSHGVPSCEFRLRNLTAESLAALIVILEKTVCILGELYGVNAFDQPGVEESKEYARAMLGKAGTQYDLLRERVSRLEASGGAHQGL